MIGLLFIKVNSLLDNLTSKSTLHVFDFLLTQNSLFTIIEIADGLSSIYLLTPSHVCVHCCINFCDSGNMSAV